MLRKRIDSFIYAGRGVYVLLKTQTNARIHAVATIGVAAAGFGFRVSETEWCLLVFAIGIVWVAEALNTSIEFVVDLASPEHHELAGKAKDVAAGAVLLAAISSATVGVIIFWPHFQSLLAFRSWKLEAGSWISVADAGQIRHSLDGTLALFVRCGC